ncbi:hypothetical protein [Brucella anthropi]|uniref:Uncharacterized protein n=1 Tax=Brucella anthropi TaxID=529 RepID=A0A011V610_BRUAN|nr:MULTISPECIES: hypothetical protein [Brucella/Ochrobactrum group]EXL03880.1 hypothetical protein BG46_26355 [Brucella anthropi]KAB2734783.1 hypothetical protein F9K89_20190 [Brucella anthropi]KAB2756112.1 hypothetical protein F9K81_17810 [Brucella anthropi]KAB2769050.1 hypothetical protein F9K84_12755 [Brucella anthropi]MBE0562955.1 hypothetical protein [Brucella anthropi]
MQENITDVALELADYARAAREAGGTTSADLKAAIDRLFQADGETPEDALAILTYAQFFLATMVNQMDLEKEGGFIDPIFRCVHKAVGILESMTGRKFEEFF